MKINLPEPYQHQKPILKALVDDETRRVILVGSRQVGKTFIAVEASIFWALSNPFEEIMIISPTDSQVQKINKQTITLLEPIKHLVKRSVNSSGNGEIEFTNGSVIRYRSAKAKDSLRGYSNSKLILDEFANIEKEVFEVVIRPSLSKGTNKKILFCSTPKGKNYFFELYSKGLSDGKKQKSFKLHYSQNPYADLEEINTAKSEMHPDFFAQEYDGEFIDGAAVFRNIDLVCSLQQYPFPKPGETYTAGIDIGMLSDFTVITIMNQKNEMVYYDRFTGLEAPELIERLLKTLRSFNPRFTYLEKNNQGLPIYNIISRQFTNIYAFDTTPQSKPILISNLINAFSSQQIKCINDAYLKSELQAFEYEVGATGKIKYSAPSGFHDDVVMSLALCWKANCEKNNIGGIRTTVVIGTGGDLTNGGIRGSNSYGNPGTMYDGGVKRGLDDWFKSLE